MDINMSSSTSSAINLNSNNLLSANINNQPQQPTGLDQIISNIVDNNNFVSASEMLKLCDNVVLTLKNEVFNFHFYFF